MQIKCIVFKGDLFQYMCMGEKREKNSNGDKCIALKLLRGSD